MITFELGDTMGTTPDGSLTGITVNPVVEGTEVVLVGDIDTKATGILGESLVLFTGGFSVFTTG